SARLNYKAPLEVNSNEQRPLTAAALLQRRPAMQRLAALVYRRRHVVLTIWILALAAAVAFIVLVGDALTPRQELPGSESVAVGKTLAKDFGVPPTQTIELVL